jgi:hypothetical protein
VIGRVGAVTAVAASLALLTSLTGALPVLGAPVSPPPRSGAADYQLGGDYRLPHGVGVVVRDWFAGQVPSRRGAYAICYVNAFQTQPDDPGVARPDERIAWPAGLRLDALEDPGWPGEVLIDISTAEKRAAAVEHVRPMLETCAAKGFRAVELDNLDGTPLDGSVPFGRAQAVDHAARLVDVAHGLGLAVAQKNTPQLSRAEVHDAIGFDFAIAEECARWRECGRYRRLHGRRVIIVEYRRVDLRRACRWHGDAVSVVLRDRLLRTPGQPGYRYARCR